MFSIRRLPATVAGCSLAAATLLAGYATTAPTASVTAGLPVTAAHAVSFSTEPAVPHIPNARVRAHRAAIKARFTTPATVKTTRRTVEHQATKHVVSAETTIRKAPKPVIKHTAPKVTADYPWSTASGSSLDTWGFTERQCVSYAAWALARAGHAISNYADGWGDASHWDDVARAKGDSVSSTPRVGDIAQWNANERSTYYGSNGRPAGTFEAGGYGHVGYVAAVYSDGSVLVQQYNATGDRSYSSMRMTAPRYLDL